MRRANYRVGQSKQQCEYLCSQAFENCEQGCTNIDGGSGCDLSCETQSSICDRKCYTPIYAIRNGTVYTLYVYDYASRNLLGSLDGWSPYTITINKFPIIATSCDPTQISNPQCWTSSVLGLLITDPGCYIVWYFNGYYTTDEVCHVGQVQLKG